KRNRGLRIKRGGWGMAPGARCSQPELKRSARSRHCRSSNSGVVLFVAVVVLVAVAVALALVATAVVVAVVVATVVVAVVVVAPAMSAVASSADDLTELGLTEDVDVRAAGLIELDHGGASFSPGRSCLLRPMS